MTVSANSKPVFHTSESSESEKREEATDVAKEIWTALLCANIRHQAYKLGLGEQPEANQAGRASDGKLTFVAPEFDALDVTQAVDPSADAEHSVNKPLSNISFQMEAGRLGTIQLRVVREGTTVSVQVGVTDPIQRALVELELGSLTQALRNAGLNVGSVRVMHPEAVGTAFAHGTVGQGKRGLLQTADTAASAYRVSRSKQLTEDDEGLNLVG